MNLAAALAIPGWMHEEELAWLATQAAEAYLVIEVGCWKGRSTVALADQTRGRVFAVDHWHGSDGDPHQAEIPADDPDRIYREFLTNMGPRIQNGAVIPLRMAAAEAARLFAPQSVDFVFIDASHLVADVRRDIALYRPLVRLGGILAGHDYAIREHIGVQQAVDEVFLRVHRCHSIWWVPL